jgi:hypothetical protein
MQRLYRVTRSKRELQKVVGGTAVCGDNLQAIKLAMPQLRV